MLLQKNTPLKKYSNFKIGGATSYFYEFNSKEDLKQVLLEWREVSPELNKIFILGGGTNILFDDNGYDGLIVKNNIDFLKRNGVIVTAGGGTLMSDLVNFCSQNSLSGFEWAGGLPGTVGGGIRGNAGAFLGEMGDKVFEIESMNIENFKIKKRSREECGFGYRQSVFKTEKGKREIILSVKFKLKKGNQEKIKRKTQERIDYRIDRHPLDLPNIGSIFKNIPIEKVPEKVAKKFESSIKQDPFPVLPTAKLIAVSGLMGSTIGGAQISTKHPNFIVNINNAKAQDVLSLIDVIKKEIKEKFNVSLEEEIMIV